MILPPTLMMFCILRVFRCHIRLPHNRREILCVHLIPPNPMKAVMKAAVFLNGMYRLQLNRHSRKAPATVFSWRLFVDNNEIGHFGNVTMSFAVSGMGTSGVCSKCFSFSVPLSEHEDYFTSGEFGGGKSVYLMGYDTTPTFYISSKSADDISINVTCFDRMTFAEADFPCSEDDFRDIDGNEAGMDINTALNRIASACGVSACFLNDSALVTAVSELPGSMLFGHTCRDVLTALSNAFCGYWCCVNDVNGGGNFMFIPFGKDISEITPAFTDSDQYEKLNTSSSVDIKNVFLSDNIHNYGSDPGGTDTVRINTVLASSGLYDALYERVRTIYSGISCKNAYLLTLPTMPLRIKFADEEAVQYMNYCTVNISSQGILSSVGRNKVDEGTWTYKNRTQRETDRRYAEGDVWKNTELTKKDGLKMVYVNENGDKKKYGTNVLDEGVTVYDGDITDAVPASDILVQEDEDGNITSVEYMKGDVKTVLTINRNGEKIFYTRQKIKDDTVIFEDKESGN